MAAPFKTTSTSNISTNCSKVKPANVDILRHLGPA